MKQSVLDGLRALVKTEEPKVEKHPRLQEPLLGVPRTRKLSRRMMRKWNRSQS